MVRRPSDSGEVVADPERDVAVVGASLCEAEGWDVEAVAEKIVSSSGLDLVVTGNVDRNCAALNAEQSIESADGETAEV